MTTLRDIAARARVSIGTVDRVLHHRGRVSEKTKARVERIAREVNYRPNIYARNLSLARTFRFAVLMPRLSQDSEYWRLPARGILKAQRELEPYNIQVRFFLFDRYSEGSHTSISRLMKAWKPDGLLLAPVLVEPARQLLSDPGFKVPFVLFDSDIPGTRPICTIGQDPCQSGLLAAHLMQLFVDAGGTVAVMKVMPDDYHINERIRGFEEGVNGSHSVRVKIYEVDSHGGQRRFQQVCRDVVKQNHDLRGIFVTNAWTHPAARFARSLAARKRFAVVGYDLVRENDRLLQQGGIDFLISQRPELQGYQGITALYRHIVLRERVPRRIMVPLDILTRDNLRYYQD